MVDMTAAFVASALLANQLCGRLGRQARACYCCCCCNVPAFGSECNVHYIDMPVHIVRVRVRTDVSAAQERPGRLQAPCQVTLPKHGVAAGCAAVQWANSFTTPCILWRTQMHCLRQPAIHHLKNSSWLSCTYVCHASAHPPDIQC